MEGYIAGVSGKQDVVPGGCPVYPRIIMMSSGLQQVGILYPGQISECFKRRNILSEDFRNNWRIKWQ